MGKPVDIEPDENGTFCGWDDTVNMNVMSLTVLFDSKHDVASGRWFTNSSIVIEKQVTGS